MVDGWAEQVCDCCGQPSGDRGLVGACDVLVQRALEVLGKRLCRSDRSRFRRLGSWPFARAYLLWTPTDRQVDASLPPTWEAVPQIVADHAGPHVDPRQVTLVLDRYTRDLIRGRRGHTAGELRLWIDAWLD